MSFPRWKHERLRKYREKHNDDPPTLSVNAGIPSWACPVDFPKMDDVVARILELGRGTWLAARDYADAYPHCLVNPSDWGLMAKMYDNKWYCGC